MARQTYGRTPWGRWFIEVLDSYSMGARLDRGRSYANTGKVLSLEFKGRAAVAKVKGNYRPFYTVKIEFPELPERDRVFQLIEEDPSLLAAVAAGELPESFLAKLKKEKIHLIPRRWEDMSRSCSCPDYGDPCKHMAALYYIIAREADADPRLLFRLRGLDLERLGARYGADLDRKLAPPFVVEAAGEKPEPAAGPAEEIDFPEIPHCAALILSLLPPKPAFSERDFAAALAEFYHAAARFVPWESAGGDDPAHRFARSRWFLDCPDPGPLSQPVLVREGPGGDQERFTIYDAFLHFRLFSSAEGTENYRFLYYLFKFLNLLCAAGAVIPCPVLEGALLRVIWLPYRGLAPVRETLDSIARLENRMLPLPEAGGKGKAGKKRGEEPRYASGKSVTALLAAAFLGQWVKSGVFAGRRGLEELEELFFQGASIDTASPALRSLPLGIDAWLAALYTDFAAWKYRFTLKAAGGKAEDDDAVPAFTLAMDVLLEDEGGIKAAALKDAVKKTGSLEVLKAPTALANYLPEIRDLTALKTTPLSAERLLIFLDTASHLLSRLGIEVVFPKNLHRELKPRLVLRGDANKKAGSLVSYLDLGSLLDWRWEMAIGDMVLSPAEWKALLKQKKGIVKFRGQFIRLDPEELSRLLKNAGSGEPTVNDFLKAHFAGDSVLSVDAEAVMERLFAERSFPVPQGLNASLREYQARGYNWVCSLLLAGFGCVLADDMGLGKTVQSIAVLLRLREEGLLNEGCLVVAPAALLENWERELSRFAPDVRVSRYHGAGRSLKAKEIWRAEGPPNPPVVFLTTYQTAVRDVAKLQETAFSLLIVDEAHLMKNAETRGAKTVKGLRAQFRLALSGTPVENRLEDMRSLFDFILPGYLGTPAEFKEAWRIPIEVMRQKDKAEALRKITSPFLLRRLKTDKTVIADLPDKITADEYAILEKEQAALYESIVAEAMEKSERTEEPSRRSALILSLLTALKQVCDHPRVYDKESPARSGLSGKATLLVVLLQEILSGGEKALIFSQYVEALECLAAIIQEELGETALLYHGGMTSKQRSAAIDRFQTDSAFPLLLVSLRAGGLGLNLTAASRVIHYDLWYNPAVENQATDRAFRIGQKRNVFVHRFITRNTFEEKIDGMLRSKRELADMTVASGESWLARMSHEELRALFNR